MNDTLLDNEIPEKFKDPETGELRADAMMKSYSELEKKFSQMPSAPKSYEDYKIECGHGLFENDMEMNKQLLEKGFTNDQAQFVYDLAAEKMVPMIVEMAGDFQADKEVEKLIEHFGGADKWQEISKQMLSFGQKNLPGDVLDSLTSSFDGVIALHNMMKGNEPRISHSDNTGEKSGESELKAMMRDPKYWRERDPSFVAKVTEGFQTMYGKSKS